MFTFGSIVIPAAQVFYRSVQSVAFVNISPVLPGHVLVAPIAHARRVSHMSGQQLADLMVTSSLVGKVVERYFGGTSLTFVTQDGKEAGQSVHHVHMHVIPRRKGDITGDKIYEEVEKWNHDVDVRPRRSADAMALEASALRMAMEEQRVLDEAISLLTQHFSDHNVDAGHGIEHALIVLSNCTRAIYACPDRDVWTSEMRMSVMLAALLHDADDRKFFGGGVGDGNRHARRIASHVLKGRDEADRLVLLVDELIGLVSASKNKDSVVAETWKLYPRWADRLEAIGWVGVVRCYVYTKHARTPLWTDATPRVTNREELAKVAPPERFLKYSGNSASMIDHYYDKLVHCASLGSDNPWLEHEAQERFSVMLDFLFEFGRSGTIDESKIV